jgi:hypothetical protein
MYKREKFRGATFASNFSPDFLSDDPGFLA